MEALDARPSLHMSKCHIVGNLMQRLIWCYISLGSLLAGVSFECQQDAIQVDTYGMLIGVNMTIPIPVNDTSFSAPSCYISIHNDFGNELIDVGAWGINGSCMTVTNVSTPGTFGMGGFCDGLSHCIMSRRRNCLEKDILFDTKYRNYRTPLVSYSTKRLEVSWPEAGGTLIFLYRCRLGSFFGVQNFEFQYFGGFTEK